MSENGCCVVCVYGSSGLYKLVTEAWNGLKRHLIQCCLMQLFFYALKVKMNVVFNFCNHLFVIIWVK